VSLHVFCSANWPDIKKHIDIAPCYDTCGIVCYENKTLCGAILFEQLKVGSAQMHICLPRPIVALRQNLFTAAADYIFNYHGKQMVYGLIPATNKKSLQLNLHAGATEIARIPKALDGVNDLVLVQLQKEECRWYTPLPNLKKENAA
jgi:hypothetical protein